MCPLWLRVVQGDGANNRTSTAFVHVMQSCEQHVLA